MLGIERVTTHPFADSADLDIVGHDDTDVTVLAVATAQVVRSRDHTCPDRRRRSLRDRLELEGWLTFGRELAGALIDHHQKEALIKVATQFGLDAAEVDGGSPDAPRPMPAVELHRKQDVRRLGPAVPDERLVRRSFEVRAESGAMVKAAIALLVDGAVASGAIRLDIEPLDLLRALAGVAGISSAPGWEESAKRLVDILIAGVRIPTTE